MGTVHGRRQMEFCGLGEHWCNFVSFLYEDSIPARYFWPRPDSKGSGQQEQIEVKVQRKEFDWAKVVLECV